MQAALAHAIVVLLKNYRSSMQYDYCVGKAAIDPALQGLRVTLHIIKFDIADIPEPAVELIHRTVATPDFSGR